MVKNSLVVFLLVLFVSSCDKKFDAVEEINDYIKDANHGFSQTKIINGIKINLTYKPSEVVAINEFKNSNYSEKRKDSIKKNYNKYLYFLLSYSKDDKEILSTIPQSREEFNSIQNTLTFEMNDKVTLTNNSQDTIPFIDSNFSRTYGFARSTNILLIFEKNKDFNGSKEIYFNLADIGLQTGDVKFKYTTSIINQKNFKLK